MQADGIQNGSVACPAAPPPRPRGSCGVRAYGSALRRPPPEAQQPPPSQEAGALRLPDGRELPYAIRRSARAKRVRLRLSPQGELRITAPRNMPAGTLREMVQGKAGWVQRHLDRMRPRTEAQRPERIRLDAIGEDWVLDYRPAQAKAMRVEAPRPGLLVLRGAVDDPALCRHALRWWLAQRAKQTLVPWLRELAAQHGLKVNRVFIKNQRTRWGSCSVNDNINLNCKLLFLPPRHARHVLLHELAHLAERNHSERFWDRLRELDPDTDQLRTERRLRESCVPAWAHRPES